MAPAPDALHGAPPALRRLAEEFLHHGVAAVSPGLRPLAELDLAAAAQLPPLPYHDAAFSARVLRLQLDQSTDQSSRRLSVIAGEVDWIARRLPPGSLRRIFHPLCGPGLFALALRARGVQHYLGVDVGPAVIGFARRVAGQWPAFTFEEGDAERYRPAGEPFSTCLLTYEALNAFPPRRAQSFLALVAAVTTPGGWLAMDVRGAGNLAPEAGRRSSYHPHESVFAAGPHLLLGEPARLGDGSVSGHRFLVVRREAGTPVTMFHSLVWHYSTGGLETVLDSTGFDLEAVEQPFVFDSDVPEAATPLIVLARRRS